MPTELEVVNQALRAIGDDAVTSVTADSSKRGEVVAARWETVRNAVFRAHPWRSLSMRAELEETDAPVWGYDNAFELPDDFLRLRRTDLPRGCAWAIEGRTLVCNSSTVKIQYTALIDDPDEWDPLLLEAVVARLAGELTVALTGDRNNAEHFYNLYNAKLQEARGTSAQEATPDDPDPEDLALVRL